MSRKPFVLCAHALAVAAALVLAGAAQADLVLTVDLTVANSVTISATNGLSAATISGSSFTGVYMKDFYSVNGAEVIYSNGVGNFTTASNPSDNSPGIFRNEGTDPGLNIWTFSSDSTVSFTVNALAFTGSATWAITPIEYAEMIADGNRGGDAFFPADTIDDLTDAEFIGTYEVIVTSIPAPGALTALGLGFIGMGPRRRRA